jgi:hypothetical protein
MKIYIYNEKKAGKKKWSKSQKLIIKKENIQQNINITTKKNKK